MLRPSRPEAKGRVGQIILDANGEYANENPIEKGAIRNAWKGCSGAKADDVVTYGLHPHPRDPSRRLVKLNFFATEPADWADRSAVAAAMTPLIQAKQVADAVLAQENAKYITAFRNVTLEAPEVWDRGAQTRYRRRATAYRAVLKKAGMAPPDNLPQAVVKGLTNEDLRKALANGDYARASEIFAKDRASWDEAFEGFQKLGRAIKDDDQGYKSFNDTYRKDNERRDWHGTSPEGILAILEHSGGLRVIGKVAPQHSAKTSEDYADLIVRDLADGKLVIIDQSTGDPQMNEAASKRLMWRVFEHQKASFINPKLGPDQEMVLPPDVIVYVEEAHSLLPKDGEDLKDVWARVAKEGSKYRMGLVYATQEPSSIMTNILSNTDNWFVAHLNGDLPPRRGGIYPTRDGL